MILLCSYDLVSIFFTHQSSSNSNNKSKYSEISISIFLYKYNNTHKISSRTPFIINPVLLAHFSDKVEPTNIELSYTLESNEKQLIMYLSSDCYHCKEALLKLKVASEKKGFPLKIVVVSYNEEIKNYLVENNINFELKVISAKIFIEETALSFPKFALIKNNIILKKWTNPEFNYAVLDELYR